MKKGCYYFFNIDDIYSIFLFLCGLWNRSFFFSKLQGDVLRNNYSKDVERAREDSHIQYTN